MKADEIREKNDTELLADLDELQKSLFKMKMQRRSTQNARHHQFGQTRRDIARLKTILLERSRATTGDTDNDSADETESAE